MELSEPFLNFLYPSKSWDKENKEGGEAEKDGNGGKYRQRREVKDLKQRELEREKRERKP